MWKLWTLKNKNTQQDIAKDVKVGLRMQVLTFALI